MNSLKIIMMVALFVILTPGVFVRAPGSKYVSALIHGALFAFVWYLTCMLHPVMRNNLKPCEFLDYKKNSQICKPKKIHTRPT